MCIRDSIYKASILRALVEELRFSDVLFAALFWYIVAAYAIFVIVYGVYEIVSKLLRKSITNLVHRLQRMYPKDL